MSFFVVLTSPGDPFQARGGGCDMVGLCGGRCETIVPYCRRNNTNFIYFHAENVFVMKHAHYFAGPQVYNDKVQSTAAILGFSSPTFGPDIMLPPSINVQLRRVVMKAHGSKRRKATSTEAEENAE